MKFQTGPLPAIEGGGGCSCTHETHGNGEVLDEMGLVAARPPKA